MDITAFQSTLSSDTAPGSSPALCALWYDGKGDWQRAHATVQDDPSRSAAWVHAYLHRKEGDISNAGYWYRRAGRPTASGSLEQEWRAIVTTLLAATGSS
jgi:hypothetical protein